MNLSTLSDYMGDIPKEHASTEKKVNVLQQHHYRVEDDHRVS